MPRTEISPKAFFALRPEVKQNAYFISDFQVLYPAGSVLVIHNFYENRQKFIKLYDKSLFLEFVAISNNRRYAAIIENGEKGQVVIFDLYTLKKRRTLNLPTESTTNRFESAAFTHDDKFILAITGDPDWMMISYKWEKGKVDSSTKANSPNNPAAVVQVQNIVCSPFDVNDVCIFGAGVFRILSFNETVWRQGTFPKADQVNITTACWLSNERILCGTSDGKLLVVDNAELKAVFTAFSVMVIQIKEKEEIGLSQISLSAMKISLEAEKEEDKQVRSLLSFAKGFAFSCKAGLVHLFEKESENSYRKRNVFRILEMNIRKTLDFEMNIIKHLSINISQDKLLATTNRAQIYTVRLGGPDLLVAPEIPFKILGEPLHHGQIGGLCMCVWKPLFLTCGIFDRTVRLWNYQSETVELVKYFNEDVFSVSFHPTGYFLSVGFREVLGYMILLLDDIQPFREIPIRECPLSVFSWLGHLLAAVKNGNIELFNCVSFENVLTLKTNVEHVNSIVWSRDDKKLVSCGDSYIFEWNVLTGKKTGEVFTDGMTYRDCAISSDGKFIYAVGSDGTIKEITDSNIIRSVELTDGYLESVVISRSDSVLIISDIKGTLYTIRIPFTVPYEHSSFFYHFSTVTHMKLTYDDQTFVTSSASGAVIMWKVIADGKVMTLDKDFSYSKDILVNKKQLQEKMTLMKDLGVRLFDLEMNHILLMRSKESLHTATMKEVKDKYNSQLDELGEKISLTERDQENQLLRISEEVNQLKMKQDNEMTELNKNYGQKLALEDEKISKLKLEKEEIASMYEEQFLELKQSKEKATQEIAWMYEEKLQNIKMKLEGSYQEKARLIEEHAKIKEKLEEDTDREIIETKAKYEKILKEEREKNEVLKGEASNMKIKYGSAQKELDDNRHKINLLHIEHKKYIANIQSLEKDIQDLKREIIERDNSLGDKDTTIYELKKKIQELEKYKMVLDYKVLELKNQIDPKDREIREKKEQIEEMEKELENLQRINISLELQKKELKEKISATEKDLKNYEKNHQSATNLFKQIKIDLYRVHKSINDFKMLKDGIKEMYAKYHKDEEFHRGQPVVSDLQKEFMIKREFLEKTISALESTIRKNKESKKDDGLKVLEDNVVLVEELNEMRKQLKDTVDKVQALENLLDVKPRKCITPKEAYNKLQRCLKNQETIKEKYEKVTEMAWQEMQAVNNRITVLYENIERLVPQE